MTTDLRACIGPGKIEIGPYEIPFHGEGARAEIAGSCIQLNTQRWTMGLEEGCTLNFKLQTHRKADAFMRNLQCHLGESATGNEIRNPHRFTPKYIQRAVRGRNFKKAPSYQITSSCVLKYEPKKDVWMFLDPSEIEMAKLASGCEELKKFTNTYPKVFSQDSLCVLKEVSHLIDKEEKTVIDWEVLKNISQSYWLDDTMQDGVERVWKDIATLHRALLNVL